MHSAQTVERGSPFASGVRSHRARFCCAAGERSLHTGEVVGSIPTAPTNKVQQSQDLDWRPLPFPPVLRRERSMFPPAKLGENRGTLFDRCSAHNRSITAPWRPPPDHKNGSPGTAATVTGAEFQSVVRRTTARYPKIVAHAGPPTPIKSAAPLRIVIEATASGRKWTARLDDRVLCVTASPFVKSARSLLAEGYSADIVIEMWRPNTNEFALRGRLGVVAGTVIDGETGSRCAKNGSPARDHEQGGKARLRLVCARPRAVLGARRLPRARPGRPRDALCSKKDRAPALATPRP